LSSSKASHSSERAHLSSIIVDRASDKAPWKDEPAPRWSQQAPCSSITATFSSSKAPFPDVQVALSGVEAPLTAERGPLSSSKASHSAERAHLSSIIVDRMSDKAPWKDEPAPRWFQQAPCSSITATFSSHSLPRHTMSVLLPLRKCARAFLRAVSESTRQPVCPGAVPHNDEARIGLSPGGSRITPVMGSPRLDSSGWRERLPRARSAQTIL
jgi:hypothetical protein